MLKAIIADDDIVVSDLLENTLSLCCPNVKIVKKTLTVSETEQAISNHQIDLLFLDISMPDGDVFEMLNRVGPYNFYVIFVTAYNQFAIKAIKQSAIDYILKPIYPTELKTAIQKVEKKILEKTNYYINEFIDKINQQNKKLEIVNNKRIIYLRISDIIRCEAEGNYVRIATTNNENYFVSKKLKDYQNLLSQYSFFRVHHSHLININHVKSIFTKELMILMSDNKGVPLSRKNKEEFLKLMSNLI